MEEEHINDILVNFLKQTLSVLEKGLMTCTVSMRHILFCGQTTCSLSNYNTGVLDSANNITDASQSVWCASHNRYHGRREPKVKDTLDYGTCVSA